MKAGVKYRPPKHVYSVWAVYPELALVPPAAYDIDASIPGIDYPLYDGLTYNNCVIAARAHQTRRLLFRPGQPLLKITDAEVDNEYIKENKAEDNGRFLNDGLNLETS